MFGVLTGKRGEPTGTNSLMFLTCTRTFTCTLCLLQSQSVFEHFADVSKHKRDGEFIGGYGAVGVVPIGDVHSNAVTVVSNLNHFIAKIVHAEVIICTKTGCPVFAEVSLDGGNKRVPGFVFSEGEGPKIRCGDVFAEIRGEHHPVHCVQGRVVTGVQTETNAI